MSSSDAHVRLSLRENKSELFKRECMGKAWDRIFIYLREFEALDDLVEGNSMNLQDVEVICDTLDSLVSSDGKVDFAELLRKLSRTMGGRCCSGMAIHKYMKERYVDVFRKDTEGAQGDREGMGQGDNNREQQGVLWEADELEEELCLQPTPSRG